MAGRLHCNFSVPGSPAVGADTLRSPRRLATRAGHVPAGGFCLWQPVQSDAPQDSPMMDRRRPRASARNAMSRTPCSACSMRQGPRTAARTRKTSIARNVSLGAFHARIIPLRQAGDQGRGNAGRQDVHYSSETLGRCPQSLPRAWNPNCNAIALPKLSLSLLGHPGKQPSRALGLCCLAPWFSWSGRDNLTTVTESPACRAGGVEVQARAKVTLHQPRKYSTRRCLSWIEGPNLH